VRATEEVLTQIKAAAAVSSGLMINERKTKYASKNITVLEKHLIMDGQVWEGVQNLRFIGTVTNSHNVLYVQRNNEARSCNHCCSGKAINIIYAKCVFVALVIQHAMRMRRIASGFVRLCSIFPHPVNSTVFGEKVTEHKICVLISFTAFA